MPKRQQDGQPPAPPGRIWMRFGLAAILALLTYAVASRRSPVPEPPAGPSYYTGPMLSKSGVWVTGDGKIVPPPPGWNPALAGDSAKQANRRRLGGM